MSPLFCVQVKRGTRVVIMDKNGGSDAINIARSITKLSNRKAYVVAVLPYLSLMQLAVIACLQEMPCSNMLHTARQRHASSTCTALACLLCVVG